MHSALEHVQREVLRELQQCVKQHRDVNATRILAATHVARGFAVQSLQAFHDRIDAEHERNRAILSAAERSITLPAPRESGKKSLEGKKRAFELDEESLESTLCDEPLATTKAMPSPPDAPVGPASPFRASPPSPAEIYDLSAKVLPTLAPWRWCEAACRARAGTGPAAPTLRALADAAPDDRACAHCPALTVRALQACIEPDDAPDGRTGPGERERTLAFLLQCHALSGSGGSGGSEEAERPVWVCHRCVARNPYDAAAGPMDGAALARHYRARHADGAPARLGRRTPRPLTVYAAWEVRDTEAWAWRARPLGSGTGTGGPRGEEPCLGS